MIPQGISINLDPVVEDLTTAEVCHDDHRDDVNTGASRRLGDGLRGPFVSTKTQVSEIDPSYVNRGGIVGRQFTTVRRLRGGDSREGETTRQ